MSNPTEPTEPQAQEQIVEYILTLTVKDTLQLQSKASKDFLTCKEVQQQVLEKLKDALPYGLKVISCEIEGMTQSEIDDSLDFTRGIQDEFTAEELSR